ncbi:12727_t:CDS:1 [Dentiscutata heterogama]|uniref:12727_t:CDS:1 n=1 Tax=Dentiscutata heterogama TaxID=1316150 RepID=A0ACA9KTK3_9GLOM|nr:12727_t:CDS:1 [Dentiscutata heterogama]
MSISTRRRFNNHNSSILLPLPRTVGGSRRRRGRLTPRNSHNGSILLSPPRTVRRPRRRRGRPTPRMATTPPTPPIPPTLPPMEYTAYSYFLLHGGHFNEFED